MDAALKLFLKHGVKRVTVEEISQVAEVSKATFYKYFNNKKVLIEHLRETLMEEGFSKFDEISQLDLTYPEKIKKMSLWRMAFFKKLEGEFLNEILDLDAFREQYMERFINNIKTAQTRGEIKKDLSPALIAMVVEKFNEMTRENKWKNIFDDYATYQDQLRTLLFFGMLDNE